MDKKPSQKSVLYRGKQYIVIGWREWVCLPDLGVNLIKAKIDTGARTSALHAFDIERYQANGKSMVRFDIHPIQRNHEKVVKCTAELVDLRLVRNSGAHRELRYIIQTRLIMGGLQRTIEISLTNRRLMTFRMLLGRKALQNHYIINPSKSYIPSRL